ncbi:efflux RND transporter periplasmic adaptor subunit [Aerosakkonemataceae cyanobacterium BLCC-F50]|uniref:Efflux RND transporter periplasmic adaptor subunit n=1 Tax=Floridaenema flaviceps BLCC-F50 TaxID=3153642 RepID=A0ABV4XX07_9CYAN
MTSQLQSPPSPPLNSSYVSISKKLRFRWLIGLLLVSGIVGGGFSIYRAVSPSRSANSRMLTIAVQQKSLPITISANGNVKPERTINLSPKTSGYLKQLLVKEGDRVQEGQIVAYMDNSNLQGQLTQARAQLAQQEANLKKLLNGNRPEDIAQAQAQVNEVQAKLQQLQTGNRPEDIAQAQAQVNEAQAKLQQLQTGNRPEDIAQAQALLSKAQTDLKLAEDDLQRYQRLFREGAISEQTVIQKRSARDVAQASVNQAQAALKLQRNGTRSEEIAQARSQLEQRQQALNLLKVGYRPEEIAQARSQLEQRQQALNLLKAGSRPEDIEVARAQVESARGALQTIQTQLNDTIIKAPFSGIVTKKYADPGSFVTPTTTSSSVEGSASSSILTLASTYQVVAYLDEANVARVKIGQPVKITADSYPDRTFNGTVSQIAAQATTTANVTSFEVKINLEPAAQELLKVGTNTEVEFQVGQLNNALMVPAAAIVRQQNGTGVYVLGQDQKPVFKPIQIGTTLDEQTEVKTGLDKGDRVLISFPPGMEPKAQIRGPLGDLTGGRNRNNNRTNNPPLPPAP